MFRSVQTHTLDESAAGTAARVDLAPLIDVVFILLIFFLVSATLVPDRGFPITRPSAAASETIPGDHLRVHVTADGDLYLDGRRMDLGEWSRQVHARFSDRPLPMAVVVVPDAETSAGRLIAIVDAARSAGATEVLVATSGDIVPDEDVSRP